MGCQVADIFFVTQVAGGAIEDGKDKHWEPQKNVFNHKALLDCVLMLVTCSILNYTSILFY
jgi:hypothetical protein